MPINLHTGTKPNPRHRTLGLPGLPQKYSNDKIPKLDKDGEKGEQGGGEIVEMSSIEVRL